MAKLVAELTPEQLERRRAANRIRHKRDHKLHYWKPERRKKKLAQTRAGYHRRWASATPEQKEQRRVYERNRSRRRWAAMTPAQRRERYRREYQAEVAAQSFDAAVRIMAWAERTSCTARASKQTEKETT